MRNRRGYTLVETCITLGLITAAIGVAGVQASGTQAKSKRLRDASQLQRIHTAMKVRAKTDSPAFEFLRPGKVNRIGAIVGRGPEDELKNDHASLYAAGIATNMFDPTLLVSPLERNARVTVCSNYDYTQYNPAADTFWDGDVSNASGPSPCSGKGHFQADLDKTAHLSYATLSLQPGKRREAQWRGPGSDTFVILASRGPRDGIASGQGFTDSVTLKMHEAEEAPMDQWFGAIVFADGSCKNRAGFELPGPDNLFRRDDAADDADMLLTITRAVDGKMGRVLADGPGQSGWMLRATHSWD